MTTGLKNIRKTRACGTGSFGVFPVKGAGRCGFTLIELLVTVGIIIVLVALLFPAYKLVLLKAQGSKCASNLRQIYLASESYSMDNNGRSLPGSYAGSTSFWMWTLASYLGASSQGSPAKITCPSSLPADYWAWGYGLNSRPGYVGAATTSYDASFNWDGVSYGRAFQSINITSKSRRFFISDSTEWQVTPASSAAGVASFPDYNRHGKGACNVLFFDGHVQSMKSVEINQALYDPGKL